MRLSAILGHCFLLFLLEGCLAHRRFYNHAHHDDGAPAGVQELGQKFLMALQRVQQEQQHVLRGRRVEQQVDDDDAIWEEPESGGYSCEQAAAESSSVNVTCSCNLFDDRVVELTCQENCLYCGDSSSEASSCGKFSFGTNLTDGVNSNIMSYTTRFQYDGTGGRYESISLEESNCNDRGECSSCRVFVNETLCNSCSICSDGAIVDCENVVVGSSVDACLSPPGPGLFEGFGYDAVECIVPPPPPNDDCTSATPIVPGEVISGMLSGAIEDVIVPSCQIEAGTHGVWYSFEGTGSSTLVSTCSETTVGTGLVAVYEGSECDLLACTEGAFQLPYCPGYTGGSSVLLSTEPNKAYHVYVSGGIGSFGNFDLGVTTFAELGNDQCSSASEISVDGSPVVGTIEFSVNQRGRLGVCDTETVDNYYGVAWYRFVAPRDAALRASTCSNSTIGWMSSNIAITAGDCDALACVEQSKHFSSYDVCGEGNKFVDFKVEAGTSYNVAVWGGGYGDVGLLELEIRSLNPPNNDNCENAQRIDVFVNFSATFSDVTMSNDELDEVCFREMGTSNSGGIWYSFVGTGDIAIASASSNDFSPYLTIYSGSCGALECISPAKWDIPRPCSNFQCGKQSQAIATEDGTLYHLLVSGSGPITGNFDFSLRAVPPMGNDECIGAVELEPTGELIIGNLEGGIIDEDFYDTCTYSSPTPGVWYVVVGNGGMLRADTCSQVTNFDTMISVFRGNCTNLECVGVNDDGCQSSLSSSVIWLSENEERYYIRVSAAGSGLPADFGLKVATFVPAINDACNGAINLALGGDLLGTMEGASGLNDSTSCYGSYDIPALWYYVDGVGSALKVSTCSSNNTFYGGIQAFEGITCSDLKCVGLTDEGPGSSGYKCPSTWFLAEEGLRYYILLIDYSRRGTNNIFSLSAKEFEVAANDVCEAAFPIAVGADDEQPVVVGTTTNALGDNVTCDYYESTSPGVWYSVTGTGNTLMASTCSSVLNYDSAIYVFTGGCGALECVAFGRSGFSACGDLFNGGTRALFRTEVDVEYFILVTSSFASVAGDFGLLLSNTVPPPNDVCSDAIEIIPNSGVITGSLTNATKYVGMEYNCAYDPTAVSVWYSVMGTGDLLAISTCSSRLNFEAAISVSTGSCGDHVCIATIASNVVDCPGSSYSASRVTLRTEIGVKYFIVVEGLGFPSQADFDLTVSALQVPNNDVCTGAIVIRPDEGPVSGSITNATGFDDVNSTCCGIFDVPDVWYSMIGTGEVYAISTCSSVLNFDTTISLSRGTCGNQEWMVYNTYGYSGCTESSYSAARVVFRTEVGVEYFIVVIGINYPLEGEFTLSLSTVEVPANDACSGAITIQPNNATTIRGSLANATGNIGFNSSCEYSSEAASVWFVLNGTGDVYSISTCSSELTFDSALSVSYGSCDNQTCLISSAYNIYDCTETPFASAEVTFRTEPGVQYFIQVQGLTSPSDGTFALLVSTVVVPQNDECNGALAIGSGTESVIGSITNATGPDILNYLCAYSYNAADVWYSFIGTGESFSISTCSRQLNFESALSVSKGSCGNPECIVSGAFNDDTCQVGTFSAAKVTFPTEAGVEYFISVQGIDYPSEGEFELKILTID